MLVPAAAITASARSGSLNWGGMSIVAREARYMIIARPIENRTVEQSSSVPVHGVVGMAFDDHRQEDEQHEQPQGDGRPQRLEPASVALPQYRQQTREPFAQGGAILPQERQAVTGDRTQEGLRFMAFGTWDAPAAQPSTA